MFRYFLCGCGHRKATTKERTTHPMWSFFTLFLLAKLQVYKTFRTFHRLFLYANIIWNRRFIQSLISGTSSHKSPKSSIPTDDSLSERNLRELAHETIPCLNSLVEERVELFGDFSKFTSNPFHLVRVSTDGSLYHLCE